jgi:hypothetical protein
VSSTRSEFSFPSHFSADDAEPLDEFTREQNRSYLQAIRTRERWAQIRAENGDEDEPVNNLDYAI